MQELMEWITTKLKTHGNAYFEDLPRDDEGKAIIDDIKLVFNIPNVLDLGNGIRLDVPLIIDIWGMNEQTLDIESLVVELDEDIKNDVYRSNTLVFNVKRQRNWIQNIPDEDKNIRRKRLNYTIKFYK